MELRSLSKSNSPRTIILVGMMGVGKSSVGWRLARRLGIPFFDSDKEVEQAAGCTVPDIYALWGEEAFRKVESKVIRRLLDAPPHVLSAGDGSFIQEDLREKMLEGALCIWLKTNLETIYRRVSRRKEKHQLPEGGSQEELQILMEERAPAYVQAHLTIEGQEESHDLTVGRILEKLAERFTQDAFPRM